MSDHSAVRYFVPDGSRLPRGLHGRLVARQGEIIEPVITGQASDWADYRHRVGVIAGMKEAIEICEEMEKEEAR
jgi:hypothetical protein